MNRREHFDDGHGMPHHVAPPTQALDDIEEDWADHSRRAFNKDPLEVLGEVEDNWKPSRIAADWHGGQSSPLYKFASTGYMHPGLEDEIQSNIDSPHTDAEQVERLKHLLDHVEMQRMYPEEDLWE